MATGLNGVRTVYSYNDPLDRLTQKVQAAGLTNFETQTNVVYSSPTDVNVYQDQNNFGDEALRMETQYDGLGRKLLTNEYEGGGSYIQTTETYDALGRVAQTTNPSRPGDGLNYTTAYGYDALGRPASVTTPDGAVARASYSGFYTTVTDQAGNARVLDTDALGRLAAVWENPSGYNYETTYAYDGLDDLTQVNQGSETRKFGYDGLGRLTSAILYGYVLKESRPFWHAWGFWLALISVLSLHTVAFIIIFQHVEHWSVLWFLFMYPVEIPGLAIVCDWAVHVTGAKPRYRSNARRNP